MVIVLVCRFVRPDREPEFLASYRAQAPLKNPAFLGETLTRVSDAASLPATAKGLSFGGVDCVTYLNIARWNSWEAFAKQFEKALSLPAGFDPEIETAPRQRAVLEVVAEPESN